LKKSDEVNEVSREHHPDESEESALTLPKSSDIGGGRNRAFEQSMIGQSVFCDGQNFHSIVTVAPLHVSKPSRVLEELTDSPEGAVFDRKWHKI
jgi:hypothetical protein